MKEWREDLYLRLEAHMHRVHRQQQQQQGQQVTELTYEEMQGSSAPRLVAFTGKRQWCHLFTPPLPRCSAGLQHERPEGWPLPLTTEVWVLPSSSGRAVMTKVRALGVFRCHRSGVLARSACCDMHDVKSALNIFCIPRRSAKGHIFSLDIAFPKYPGRENDAIYG